MNVLVLLLIIGLILLFTYPQKTSCIKSDTPEYAHHVQVKPIKAITGYQHRYRKKRNPEDLLHVADVFNWGLPGLKPHKPVAKCIYTQLARGLNPADEQQRLTRIEAHERLLQMHDPNEPQLDLNEPHYQGPANHSVPEILDNILNYDLNLAPVNTRRGRARRGNRKSSTKKKKTVNKLIEKYAPYKTDANSVHDSAVTQSIKQSVDKLTQVSNPKSSKDLNIDKLREYILTGGDPKELTPQTREKALKSLDIICRTNGMVSNLGMKETDVLNLVYNRIQQSTDPELRGNLEETLVKELADAARGGSTVCTVGRVSRMVDTLNIADPTTTIKDSSVIRREMLDKACKIRNDIYNNLPGAVKQEIDSLKDSERVTEYENRVKQEITDTLREDYVDTKIMKEDKFRLELDKWIEDI